MHRSFAFSCLWLKRSGLWQSVKLTFFLLKFLWNVKRKKNTEKKNLNHIIHFSFQSFNNQYQFFFYFLLKETNQICPFHKLSVVYVYIYILQPGRVIFTNHTKRNNKSRIIPDFWFPTELQRRSQSETNFTAGLCSVVSHSPTRAPHVHAGASMCPTELGASEPKCHEPSGPYWTLYL